MVWYQILKHPANHDLNFQIRIGNKKKLDGLNGRAYNSYLNIFLLTIMGLVSWNEKNQIFEKINYFFNSIIGVPAQLKKTGGAFFQLFFFQLLIISESWRRMPRAFSQIIYPAPWGKPGVHLHLFFSITINYNYFRILGLGDKEPTFFSFQQQLIIATRL